MIASQELHERVAKYRQGCLDHQKEPTYIGLGFVLGVSGQTIRNVVTGTFNGHQYTEKPHISRCVNNSDFDLIRALFEHH